MSKQQQTQELNDFIKVDYCEPHVMRKNKILEKHPEIKQLYGPEPNTKWVCLAMFITQVTLAYLMKDCETWWIFVGTAWMIGGVINHAALLAIHECSHNLAFGNATYDKLLAIFVGLINGVPAAITFRRYHLEHHRYQGVDSIDADLPSTLEAKLFTADSRLKKACWVLLQSAFYGLRPLLVHPKDITGWEIFNIIAAVSFDALIVVSFGWKSLLYLLLSTFLGMGAHPVAGHFISEHYVADPKTKQETFSYYGILNKVTFHVGYHNEHHDFSMIPGSRLPLVRKIAPEFYDNLIHYTSWAKVMWWYIMTPGVNSYNRVIRTKEAHDKSRAAEIAKYNASKGIKIKDDDSKDD